MADNIVIQGLDPSKISTYGTDDQSLQDLRDAQQQALLALQQRYAQPNWFKVAAGFAKPQLGGFFASLGSASEAMGESIEKQREMQIPISQMRMQMAQTNYMLAQNQKVSGEIQQWVSAHPNQLPPPDKLAEWSAKAPSSPVVQKFVDQQRSSLEQQSLSATRQQQDLTVLNSQYQAGLIPKSEYDLRLRAIQSGTQSGAGIPAAPTPQAGAYPSAPPAQASAPVAKAEEPPKVHVLQNGARVNDDVYTNLVAAGIPVISNIRTPDEQKTLEDPNNPGFTKEGRPVAKDSLHFSGNAIDLDPKKQLTDTQMDILRTQGWNNPIKNDPNHWVKIGALSSVASGAVTPTTLEDYGISGPGAQGIVEASMKELQQNRLESVKSIQSNTPEVTAAKMADLGRAATLLRDPKVQQAMGQLYKDKGFVNGLLTAMENGVHAGISSGAGGFNASVSLPIDKFLTAFVADPETKQKLTELNAIIARDSMGDMRTASQSLGGGHMNQSEFNRYAVMAPTTSQPYKLMAKYVGLRAAKTAYDQDMYNQWMEYSKNPNYLKQPLDNFFRDYAPKSYSRYTSLLDAANKLSD